VLGDESPGYLSGAGDISPEGPPQLPSAASALSRGQGFANPGRLRGVDCRCQVSAAAELSKDRLSLLIFLPSRRPSA
jgi:hypothetical protein